MNGGEVKAALGIDTGEFERITLTGELPAIRGTGSLRVSEPALEEYIARHLPEVAS
jgi:hypothetical protein